MKTRRVLLLLECTDAYLDCFYGSAEAMIDYGGPVQAFYTLAIDGTPCNPAEVSPHLATEGRMAVAACAAERGAA